MRSFHRVMALLAIAGAFAASGCAEPKPPVYGREDAISLPGLTRQIWAIAPAINLSGQQEVDPLLQADLAYQQLQQVNGLTIIPVNRVAEVYAGLRIERIQSPEQAAAICEILACDPRVLPTATAFDPYTPPKFGGSLQLFRRPGSEPDPVDEDGHPIAQPAAAESPFLQSVGMFDSTNGSVHAALLEYAKGRNDPVGPLGSKEYFVSMDRYCGFAWNALLQDLLHEIRSGR